MYLYIQMCAISMVNKQEEEELEICADTERLMRFFR